MDGINKASLAKSWKKKKPKKKMSHSHNSKARIPVTALATTTANPATGTFNPGAGLRS